MPSGQLRSAGLGTSLRCHLPWLSGRLRCWAGAGRCHSFCPHRLEGSLCLTLSDGTGSAGRGRRQQRCGECCLCAQCWGQGRLSGVGLGIHVHPNIGYVFHVKNIKLNFLLAVLLLGVQRYIIDAFE